MTELTAERREQMERAAEAAALKTRDGQANAYREAVTDSLKAKNLEIAALGEQPRIDSVIQALSMLQAEFIAMYPNRGERRRILAEIEHNLPGAGAGDQREPPIEGVAVHAEEVAAGSGILSAPGDRGADARPAEEEAATSPPETPLAPTLYRLTNGAGEYLDASGVGMTRKLAKAWSGTAPQMEAVFKRKPHLQNLDPERVPG